MYPPARPGDPLELVDTPALLIDLDRFEANLKRMSGELAGTSVKLRAHSKTHKSPIIAKMQMDLGAVGICCQKVSEAEIMYQGGVSNILISNQVVGEKKLRRLAALACQTQLMTCLDNRENAVDLDSVARSFDTTIDVLVEIDVGAGRCGVAPGADALELIDAVGDLKNLNFRGLQAYQGSAQHLRTPEERKSAIDFAVACVNKTLSELHSKNIDCPIVSGAGTGTYPLEVESGVYNEVQAGSYIFMDADYARNLDKDGQFISKFEHALYVYATILSAAKQQQAVVDAGLKSLGVDSGLPVMSENDEVDYINASDEHGVLAWQSKNVSYEVGEKVLLIPGHCDPTINLHDWYVGVRNLRGPEPYVESVWPVAARGCVF